MLTGLASNTNIVIIAERIAESALAVMAKSLESSSVTINNEHGNDWDEDLGEVTRLWVNESHESTMEAELDPDHYRTKTLIEAPDKGKKLRLSIGGMVKQAGRFIAIELKCPPSPIHKQIDFLEAGSRHRGLASNATGVDGARDILNGVPFDADYWHQRFHL